MDAVAGNFSRRAGVTLVTALLLALGVVGVARAGEPPPGSSPPPVGGVLPPGAVLPCLSLRIAPVQPLWPYGSGPYVLQFPSAYAGGYGILQLESGMGVGAVAGNCSTGSGDHQIRYGMTVDVVQGGSTIPVAVDLRAGDEPLPLPALDSSSAATIEYSVQKTSCTVLAAAQVELCDPSVELSSGSYLAFVKPRGAYASASYDKTVFTVADDGVDGDWEAAKVTSVTLSPSLNGTGATFSARGYGVASGVSSRPQVTTISQNESFAVYEDDFASPVVTWTGKPDAQSLVKAGVATPAGLEWPHVVGARNGGTFWYSVKLPTIVRDAVALCASGPNTYYKLPFRAAGGWKLFNGNYDDPISGHPDSGKVGVGNNQKYAFDFAPDSNNNNAGEIGQDVLAARSGIVVDEQTSETGNSWSTGPTVDLLFATVHFPPIGYTGVGNFVVLRHIDGTYGVYWHFLPDTITVGVGDYVKRGAVLGQDGYTGNASTPHLHFDVRGNWDVNYPPPGSNTEYPTVPVRFQDSNHPAGCWLPRVGQAIASNNG